MMILLPAVFSVLAIRTLTFLGEGHTDSRRILREGMYAGKNSLAKKAA